MSDTLAQLKRLIDTGTEAEVQTFVRDHFKELPDHMQKSLATEMFVEALEQDLQNRERIAYLKQEAIAAISMLEEGEAGNTAADTLYSSEI